MATEKMQNLEKQADLIYQISALLAADAPEGWDSIRLVSQKTSAVSSYEHHVKIGGQKRARFAPTSAIDLTGNLRTEMYQPGLGAWFIFTLDIASDGRITTRFDYDNDPEIEDVDDTIFVLEQERFPRDEEHQPEWFRERLVEGARLIAEREAR